MTDSEQKPSEILTPVMPPFMTSSLNHVPDWVLRLHSILDSLDARVKRLESPVQPPAPQDDEPQAGEDDEARKWAEQMVYASRSHPKNIAIGHINGGTGASLFLPDFTPQVLDATREDWRRFIADALIAFSRTRTAELERERDQLRAQLAAAEAKLAKLADELRRSAESPESIALMMEGGELTPLGHKAVVNQCRKYATRAREAVK
jgi:hypothetical protein